MADLKIIAQSNVTNVTVDDGNNLQVNVQDGNNITVQLTPPATQVITIDRGVSGGGGGGSGTVTSVSGTGSVNGITLSGTVTSIGDLTLGGSLSGVNLASQVTGTLPIANGGTNATTAGGALSNLGGIGTITSTDGSVTVSGTGTSRDLSVASSPNVICLVRNNTGATLTKGTAVYINGAVGQNPTVAKALATSDATSAQTLGLINADLANNSNGYVTLIGLISDINTSAYTDGAQLYLSYTTAGALTATKPKAPNHLVYVAIVEHAHPTQGKLFVKVQNGYELDELHDVQITSPANGQTIIYDATASLWKNANLTAGSGISITNAAGSVTIAATGSGGGISGSGTANYVPKFTSSSAIGNSIIVDDGTNVGIGTNTPSYKLQIQTSGNTYGICHTNGTNALATYIGDGGAYFGTTSNDNLILTTYDTAQLTITPSGDVGIGTFMPTTKLDVAGGITGTTVTANTAINLPPVINIGTNTGILEMLDGGDGYDYLNIYSWDGYVQSNVIFPGGIVTPAISGVVNLSATGTIYAGDFLAASLILTTTYSQINIVGSAATLTNFTLTLPSSTGSANQVLKTDGTGVTSWVTQGVQGTAPVTVTASTYTVAATDQWIIGNRAGTITLTLPTASASTGRSLNIKTIQAQTVVSASSNVVPLNGGSAGTAILAATIGKYATLVSDGTNWIIMGAN